VQKEGKLAGIGAGNDQRIGPFVSGIAGRLGFEQAVLELRHIHFEHLTVRDLQLQRDCLLVFGGFLQGRNREGTQSRCGDGIIGRKLKCTAGVNIRIIGVRPVEDEKLTGGKD